jgi:glycosyltransferase involved in cell wall biosynthesis
VGVVVPAKDEAARIGSTVAALVASPGVAAVVVVDDGSSDDTAGRARAAGADVVRHVRNRGKAAAMETGAARLAVLEARSRASGPAAGRPGRVAADADGSTWPLLFVDADLGGTAGNTLVLTGPVLAGDADLAIAVLPAQFRPGGGRGFVVRLARRGIVRATGWTPTQPLSGMRCLTREAFEAARPLAHGWGVETAMTIDLLSAGYRVVEVPCDLQHRVTGADWHGQLHRLRQYRDVARGLAVRRARRVVPLRVLRRLPRRVALRSRP